MSKKSMQDTNPLQSLLAAEVKSSDDDMIVIIFSGIINYWSSGAERIVGYAAGEMITYTARESLTLFNLIFNGN
jgi:PAS domain S-box-containing protein